MTKIQLSERKEEFREKLLAEAKRLKLSENDVRAMFDKGIKYKCNLQKYNHIKRPNEEYNFLCYRS